MSDQRPNDCRNRLRDEGKAYPRSGCDYCQTGGLTGCPFEKNGETSQPPRDIAMMKNDWLDTSREYFVVIAEHETPRRHREEDENDPAFEDRGPIIWETYLHHATLGVAKHQADHVREQYGRAIIAKLQFLEPADPPVQPELAKAVTVRRLTLAVDELQELVRDLRNRVSELESRLRCEK